MTTAEATRLEDINARLNEIDGRSAEAKTLREEKSTLELQDNPAGRKSTHTPPGELLGGSAEAITGQKSAYYWCGVIPVGQKPDPMDPTGQATVDAPEISPHPPQWCSIIAGMSFPQVIEPVIRRSGDAGEQLRARLPGEVHLLREEQFDRIKDEFPRHYIKWHDKFRTTRDVSGNRIKVNNPHGQSVILRSEEYIKEATEDAKEQRRRPMITQPQVTADMKPIGLYVYMVKLDASGVEPGAAPSRLSDIPRPVSELGIEAP